MPTLSGFQIAILGMDATPPAGLPELDVRRRAEATMTQRPGPVGSSLAGTCECFVASSPGQQFRVQVRNNSALNACASLYVDGEWIYSGLSYGPKHRLIYFSGKLLDESTVQQMHFVDTDTTYDSNDGRHAKEGLGTIVVKIHRVNVLGKWEGKLSTSLPMEVKPILLGEKSADPELEHRVGYCSPTKMKAPVTPQKTEWIDPKGGPPYAEFIFHYRSREKLAEMGLLPDRTQGRTFEKSESSDSNSSSRGGFGLGSLWGFLNRS